MAIDIAPRRSPVAAALMRNGIGSQPVRSHLQGMGQLAQTLAASWMQKKDAEEAQRQAEAARADEIQSYTNYLRANAADADLPSVAAAGNSPTLLKALVDRDMAQQDEIRKAESEFSLFQRKNDYEREHAQPAPPETRTFNIGDQEVTKQWSPADAQWTEIGTAPRWNPNMGERDKPLSTLGKLNDDLTAGRISREDYDAMRSKMTAPPAPVVSMTGEKEQDKTVGKYFGETYVGTQDAARASHKSDAEINRFEQFLSAAGSGTEEDLTLALRKVADAAGFDVDMNRVGAQEAMQSIGTQMGLGFVSQTKGAISNAEMELFMQAVPGLARSVEGNLLMLEMARKMNKRSRDVANLARRYRSEHGRIDDGFFDQLDRYHAENPLFTEEMQEKVSNLSTEPSGMMELQQQYPGIQPHVVDGKPQTFQGQPVYRWVDPKTGEEKLFVGEN